MKVTIAEFAKKEDQEKKEEEESQESHNQRMQIATEIYDQYLSEEALAGKGSE